MKKFFFSGLLAVISIVGFAQQPQFPQLPPPPPPPPPQGQADTLRNGAAKVFIDCTSCDMNYTRQEIPYINYVRDVKEAQIYILVTNQNAGSGGTQYTYTFEGIGDFKGMNDTLVYTSNPDETSSIVREKRTKVLKMGLMRYVARTPTFNEVIISSGLMKRPEQVEDKWNNWVFQLSTTPRYQGEATYKTATFRNSIDITKITPEIKIEIGLEQSLTNTKYINSLGTTLVKKSSNSMTNLIVKSLGEHWSMGAKVNLGSDTFSNYQFNSEFLPAIEWDLFPYSDATHKQMRFLYSIGYGFNKYNDTTIYNKTDENIFKHELNIAYQIQEKWGSVNLSLLGSNYFHDFSKNKIQFTSIVKVRILKGLSLNVTGTIAHINDQLNLKKGTITEAERLLRLSEQATKYSYNGSLGITYTFGSIYNNVVNPRFGNGVTSHGGGGF
jgi:hypothetical protein